MKRTFLVLFALTVSMNFSSCEIGDEGPNFHFVPLRIESVAVPESFELSETYQIEVTYTIPNGCTYYEGVDVVAETTSTRKVVAVGAQRTDQEACTQVVTEATTSFNFVVLYEQTYLFRFYQGEDTNGEQLFLEVEVPVN
ncbi:MAG: hypothetical protein KJO63_10520 [Maribacter sp.]|nr:hypothetical protein [Maribacter sp.]